MPKTKGSKDPYGERVKKMENEMRSLQLKVVKFMQEASKAKETAENTEKWRREAFGNIDIKNFAERLDGRIAELEENMKNISDRREDGMEKIRRQIGSLEKGQEGVKELEEEMHRLDLKQLRRYIEKLMAKTEWIEGNIERIDLDPVLEKIAEMESRMKVLKYSFPIIIE